ncbi:proteasome subunit beta type 2 [Cavenderia fasciculata]|uniref:Proteasome subunit beta type 2 n=1 Tax=Cavenderia fasciculata TaxID=261658 RepID=F4PXQ8_CACFS|nr:proteasome subunit beta type 2 [Cavenderia fasciculata]EGG19568.1 proteasome subunit beta type 2 [Cavenderia fasciculata]|eukprot:XP_004357862.1 proteasome subunit beta type 2 [Cavenderia fasciculata]
MALIDTHKLIMSAGEHGDRSQFIEFVSKNCKLYNLRNGYALSTAATANFTRSELATALRSRPYNVNLIIAGYDKEHEGSIYYMDYLASMVKLDFACHGYAAYFLLGLLDRHHKKDMSFEEGMALLKMCTQELKTRFLVGGKFMIKHINQDGVKQIPFIN